jgi:hypothetical protein
MVMSQSEVARIKQQIVAEYEAGQRALSGLAQGTARHEFIQRKTANMWHCQQRLIALVGPEQACQILTEVGL